MPSHRDEQADLDLVTAYLQTRGLVTERFSPEETQRGRTPDFRVLLSGDLVAYCEVKSPNDPWLDDLLDQAPPGVIVGGERPDPIFNRIARHVQKAATQFAAVNGDRAILNVLAFVNHDDMTSYGDLRETLTGYFHAENGSREPTMLHIAEGFIGGAKREIDLFLWFERSDGRMIGSVVNQTEPERVQRVCTLFGFDPDQIRS